MKPTNPPAASRFSEIERLESRIAPAMLLSPTTVTYQDVDGDDVTVKFSSPLFTSAAVADGILKFDTGTVAGNSNAAPEQLQLIDLTGIPGATTAGLTITVTAVHNAMHGGDGFVNVGAINATGRDLGSVKIAGDLGQVDSGDGTPAAPALKTLDVHSMGEFGTSTQAGGGSLVSTFAGAIGTLKIAGNFNGAKIETTGGADGKIGALKIGGSVFGGSVDETGFIVTTGNIDSVTIGGAVIGGAANSSGRIWCQGAKLGPVKIGGNVTGGAMSGTGSANSGKIESNGLISSVTIGGSLLGGADTLSGAIVGNGSDAAGAVGVVKITGEIRGGAGLESGGIFALDSQIASVSVGGSLIGGTGFNSGAIRGKIINAVTVLGSIIGGSDEDSGVIKTRDLLGTVFVGGSVIGGTGTSSGAVASDDVIRSVTVKGDLRGGAMDDAGVIDGDGDVGSVTIGGSIYAGTVHVIAISSQTAIGKIKIGGGVYGTSTAPLDISAVGSVANQVGIGSLDIKGSVHFTNILGGTQDSPDNVQAQLGKISIGGDFIASNIAAGIDPVDGNYGNADDTPIGGLGTPGASKIASIVIKGSARGTIGGSDHFAIIAREVGFVKIGGVTAPLTVGASNNLIPITLGATGDFTLLEIP